jgi:hypothetical protein
MYVRSTDATASRWEQPRFFGAVNVQGGARMGVGNTKIFVWQDKLWAMVTLREDDIGPQMTSEEVPHIKRIVRPYVGHSPDGVIWSDFQPLTGVTNRYIWRVHEHDGSLYATAFELSYTHRRRTWLMHSKDAVHWEEVAQWYGHQSAMWFDDDGKVFCTARDHDPYGGTKHTLHVLELGHQNADTLRWSLPPYKEWHREDLGFIIHSAVLCRAGGRLVIAGAERLIGGARRRQTTIRVHDGKKFGPPTVLYPDGDCAYPGMMPVPGREDQVLVSYYGGELISGGLVSQEIDGVRYWQWRDAKSSVQPCNIYIARVRVTPSPEK